MSDQSSSIDGLHKAIEMSGIWRGERRSSHAFLLSPSIYKITLGQKRELERLGFALHDCLRGLCQMAVLTGQSSPNCGGAWNKVGKVFATGVPSVYQELQGMHVKDIPRVLKLDLMVNQSGRFKIAEIDGHNKHGLGYSALGALMRNAVNNETVSFPGVLASLASEIRRFGFEKLKLFYSDQERFYLPEFEIVKDGLAECGIGCELFSESQAVPEMLQSGLFLDLPFLYARKELYDFIVPAYRDGRVRFMIPPKPFLGGKGVLALIRNDAKNKHLEAILRTFINSRSLGIVRSYIPETFLVGREALEASFVTKLVSKKRYVLKESISSGMKGTVFSDGIGFQDALKKAMKANMNWILQEEVVNQPQEFSWFENGTTSVPSLKTSNDWFMRVTVHYVNHRIGDLIVTARRDKSVHGAKDCLQLGTMIV